MHRSEVVEGVWIEAGVAEPSTNTTTATGTASTNRRSHPPKSVASTAAAADGRRRRSACLQEDGRVAVLGLLLLLLAAGGEELERAPEGATVLVEPRSLVDGNGRGEDDFLLVRIIIRIMLFIRY